MNGAVKHQPATPLPWEPVAKQSPDYTPLPPVRIEYSTSDDGIHFEPQDFAYIHHAAHAYPKLVEALHGALSGDPNACLNAQRLLGEIGEVS